MNRYAAIIDACVLGGGLKRNIILSLAESGLFRPYWARRPGLKPSCAAVVAPVPKASHSVAALPCNWSAAFGRYFPRIRSRAKAAPVAGDRGKDRRRARRPCLHVDHDGRHGRSGRGPADFGAGVRQPDPAGEPIPESVEEPTPVDRPKPTIAPVIGKRQAIVDLAQSGTMPTAPDFSKPTHARFRTKLAQIVAFAEAGNIAGLQAFEINPVSSSPKAMARYRDLCLIAIAARAQVTA
jgi:hypothetical protein